MTGILEALGGLGLFLLGMFVMTTGLKQLAGPGLRTALRRFTRSPTSGALVGTIVTAVVQSSSATIVTAVGFVGSGLLSFSQALGIIFGANLGTTITGWFVVVFGFKVPLGTLAFPIVLIGALTRLAGRARVSAMGEALAGFGVIFVGIGLMQSGLSGLEGLITPESFPSDTLVGRLQLVLIGIAITLVTQSSSAGVAMALTAVYAGTISFPQAAAMVIGMDLGTTATAVLATIGGGTEVRRAGLAHVVYNIMTGMGALILLSPYVAVANAISSDGITNHPEMFLVGFHTLFNGLGVVAVLPFADRFALLIERLVPIPRDNPTHRLGRALLDDAEAALDAVEQTLRELVARAASLLSESLNNSDLRMIQNDLGTLRAAVMETWKFTMRIQPTAHSESTLVRYRSAIHVEDHLDRFLSRLGQRQRLETIVSDAELREQSHVIRQMAMAMASWIQEESPAAQTAAEKAVAALKNQRDRHRRTLIAHAVTGELNAEQIDHRLDAMRWLVRAANHLWRMGHHLERMADTTNTADEQAPVSPGEEDNVDE